MRSDTQSAVKNAAPAMDSYAERFIEADLWKRSQMGLRDRSLVTVASLITRKDTAELPHYLNVALDNGVKPAEISETLTHLAFYAGWPNIFSALPVFKDVFKSREQ